jgi:hypothetical protein
MNFDRLAEELSLIESLKKMSSAVQNPSFPIDEVHWEGDSVKSASPKSDFPMSTRRSGYSHGITKKCLKARRNGFQIPHQEGKIKSGR